MEYITTDSIKKPSRSLAGGRKNGGWAQWVCSLREERSVENVLYAPFPKCTHLVKFRLDEVNDIY